MAQSYIQIQRQIEALQQRAEKLKAQEVAGVVDRIKTAIAHYGLTVEQLGLGSTRKMPREQRGAKVETPKTAAKYSDGQGNEWGGRGPRPRWLRDAVASGKSLDDFSSHVQTPSSPEANGKVKTKAKAKAKAKTKPQSKRKAQQYRDESGNTWSGFGPKPRWLKDAIASGATLEQFTAN